MTMTSVSPISNTEDVIDSRDVIARIEHLKAMWAETTGDEPSDYDLSADDWRAGLDDDEANELCDLIALAEEASATPDWRYGETLIHDDYFVEYARQTAEDIGAIPGDAQWPVYCIDWERAAQELRMDYISVDFGGATYWVRG